MKKIVSIALIALLCVSFAFANGTQEAGNSGNGLTHIEMWYNATQTEVGPLPNDWVGYDILKGMGIELEASSLPSSPSD